MKKSIIAASAASLAVAAMPVVGVFADSNPTTEFTDEVKVTVEGGCSFQSKNSTPAVIDLATPRHFDATVNAGSVTILGGTNNAHLRSEETAQTISVVCNKTDGTKTWSVAVAGSQATSNTNKMVATGSGTAIASDGSHLKETSGTTSYWSMRINSSASTNSMAPGENDAWYQVPASSSAAVVSNAATTSEISFMPEYRVYVGTAQEPDVYTGKVTYTLSDTFSN